MSPAEAGGPPERPDYKVYRSRRGLLSRLRTPDLSSLRKKGGGGDVGKRPPARGEARAPRRPADRGERPAAVPSERPIWKRVVKWVGIAALGWLLLSFLAFAVSSQIQKSKLADGIDDALHGNPFLAVSPQTILVLGTDIRSGQFAGPDQAASKQCLDAAGSGEAPPSACDPYRSDTIMLIRAGGGAFRKLSIPRDTLADIPGHGAEKINSAYALGGAKLTIRTVEQFLGINVDEVAIIDFDGFRKFIDSIGGVTVDLPTPVCSTVSDGAFNLKLSKGEHTLNGYQAITLARTRENTCGTGQFSGTDFERTQFQQLILDGIKGRLTDPLRLPYNFIKGPFIGWNAPKAMVSSMGAFTMPQLVFAAAIGGGGGTDFVKPTSATAAGNEVVPQEECLRAVKEFLGGDPPHDPECSPPA
jgi:LCP family protein required for cell wall assembly